MSDNGATQKARLRRQAFMRRAALAPEARSAAAARVVERVIDLPAWRGARTVHTYVSLPEEPDTHPLIAEARARGCRVLVPHIAGPRQPMRHAEIAGLDELASGHWGLLQPATPRFVEALDSIDVVLVPGILFDRHGRRLGYGGGYYDRFLLGVPQAVKIGLAYDEFLVAALPTEPHDIPVDLVVTPATVHDPALEPTQTR